MLSSNPSASHGLHGLTVLDDETTEWLLNTCPDINAGLQWIKEELAQTKEEACVSYS